MSKLRTKQQVSFLQERLTVNANNLKRLSNFQNKIFNC